MSSTKPPLADVHEPEVALPPKAPTKSNVALLHIIWFGPASAVAGWLTVIEIVLLLDRILLHEVDVIST